MSASWIVPKTLFRFPKLNLTHRYLVVHVRGILIFCYKATVSQDYLSRRKIKIMKTSKTGVLEAVLDSICGYFFHSALDEFGDFLFTEFSFVLLVRDLLFNGSE